MNDELLEIESLINTYKGRDLNEAETRHKIIDHILHEFLAWPRNRVAIEEYINPGFADYILKKTNGDDLLFIEAKKEGVYFELPIPHNENETSCYISIKKLISNENIKTTMTQVRNYCFDTGCEYACITNGHEWIFFKCFEKGKRWENLQAFVIRKLDFFIEEYTRAINSLSFVAITENSSLPLILTSSEPKDRTLYYPKEKILTYEHKVNSNRLANRLRPIVQHYFGVISDDDTDFMDKCYVSQREYQSTSDGMHSVIQDSLTPYFEGYGIQQLEDTGKGGRLGGKLTKNIKKNRKGEVLILFGGKGSGKSTFIKRLLHHNPPTWLRDHSVISIIDLLKTPEDKEIIRNKILSSLVEQLDEEGILNQDRDTIIATIFKDKFEIAKKQNLAGLSQKSESYNIELNRLFREWTLDKLYCAKRLVNFWHDKNKGVIVVVDNTDQFSTEIQDFCFSSAQEISNELHVVTLISMREERFHNSKTHGLLDAFQNSGFHISAPKPSTVFQKRLSYTINLLSDEAKRDDIISDLDSSFVKDSVIYLEILKNEFNRDQSPLNKFLTACAHGDIRLALDLFRSFTLSGYTNVDEMINAGTWNFQTHQVLKPVMTPDRYFYDEMLSAIPNIFQLRSKRHSSHFTALRILRKISQGIDIRAPAYHDAIRLKAYFSETFNMKEDFEMNMDMLLKHGFVESNNRLDQYSDDVDSVKITNYGLYMSQDLAYFFTYLDLICTDCGVFSQKLSNHLSEAARTEYALFNRGERFERVKIRLDRAHEFIKYLQEEEAREKECYVLDMPEKDMFTFKIYACYITEKERVLRSASKNKKTTRGTKS
ncbi:hypothetical protein [Aeromonas enteropelogenes]|uniref:hypothetical protein n=1 Tax=Aeromonas enteropelogenes TaxID=29489 RepID=UPI003BA0167B